MRLPKGAAQIPGSARVRHPREQLHVATSSFSWCTTPELEEIPSKCQNCINPRCAQPWENGRQACLRFILNPRRDEKLCTSVR